MRQTGSEYLIELKLIYRNVILKSLLYSHMPSSVYIFIHAIYTFLYMPPTLYHLHLLHARISLRPWHDQQVEHLAPLLLPFRLPLPTCSTACTWSISQKLSAQISNNKYQKQKKEKETNNAKYVFRAVPPQEQRQRRRRRRLRHFGIRRWLCVMSKTQMAQLSIAASSSTPFPLHWLPACRLPFAIRHLRLVRLIHVRTCCACARRPIRSWFYNFTASAKEWKCHWQMCRGY